MTEYRITKYNPKKRNKFGHYLDKDEWTEFSEVGTNVTLKECEAVEASYIQSAKDFIISCGIEKLKVVALEDYQKRSRYKKNDLVPAAVLEIELQSLLRGDFWCRLESDYGFIHVGHDYYMYIGVNKVDPKIIERVSNRGLFVEEYISPLHPENC